MSKKRQNEFLVLYEPVHAGFERFCRARVYGEMDSEDLMNETLLKAYQKLNELKNKEVFFSFLCGISIRILANNNRKKKVDEVELGESQNNIEDNSNSVDRNGEISRLYRAMAMLPDKQRESLALFEISGFTIKEIAEMQSSTESSVKQRLKRGRERLREILTAESTFKMGEGTL